MTLSLAVHIIARGLLGIWRDELSARAASNRTNCNFAIIYRSTLHVCKRVGELENENNCVLFFSKRHPDVGMRVYIRRIIFTFSPSILEMRLFHSGSMNILDTHERAHRT